MDDKRMNYWHMCECGRHYQGFIHQNTCWDCIKAWLKGKGWA